MFIRFKNRMKTCIYEAVEECKFHLRVFKECVLPSNDCKITYISTAEQVFQSNLKYKSMCL